MKIYDVVTEVNPANFRLVLAVVIQKLGSWVLERNPLTPYYTLR